MEIEDKAGRIRVPSRKKDSLSENLLPQLMRNNSRLAWFKSTQAFSVTRWRSEVLGKRSQGGGILTMYGLILGHILWKDFAQLGDQEALEFLKGTADTIK